MKKRMIGAAVAALVGASMLPAHSKESMPRTVTTPPGQVKIVTVNARQNAVLGIKRFEDMLELVRGVRRRPQAFDGGYKGGVAAPDVVIVQEVRTSNLEIMEHLFRQRFPHRYRVAGPEEATAQILYNPDTVTLVGDPITFPDACLDEQSSGKKTRRLYQLAHFTENETSTAFVVVAVHLAKNYGDAEACRERNVTAIQTLVAAETSPVLIAGDFNKRAVNRQHECDPEEGSDPQTWYSMLTGGTEGVTFQDAVKAWHVQRHRSMTGQWTHEQKAKSPTCNGSSLYRRSRIDYLFSRGATIAEASADDPGWAGDIPGTKRPGVHKYSDHRFVWGRFILGGPPAPTGISAAPAKRGHVELSWSVTEGATSYRIYRAIGRRDFSELAVVGAEANSYTDTATEHGRKYRYSVAPIGPGGGQGLESKAKSAKADSVGPKVVSITPYDGKRAVSRRAVLRVTFSEGVLPDSVSDNRIRLFRGKKEIDGKVRRTSDRVLVFDPDYPLRYSTNHYVKVKPVRDKLGNLGGGFYNWTFTTERAPKKRKNR